MYVHAFIFTLTFTYLILMTFVCMYLYREVKFIDFTAGSILGRVCGFEAFYRAGSPLTRVVHIDRYQDILR